MPPLTPPKNNSAPRGEHLLNADSVEHSALLTEVAGYYAEKLALHGDSPQGVDWNGLESQVLRFAQIEKIIANESAFSVNDLGCGYGAFFEYLQKSHTNYSYLGVDVSAQMIHAARQRYARAANARFILGAEAGSVTDYGVASGIFNVRHGRSDTQWRSYLEDTLDVLDRSSRLGFAFNCLSLYSDADKRRDYLYYADPCLLFDLCKRRYAKNVALLHDYGLYEFTILVRKSP